MMLLTRQNLKDFERQGYTGDKNPEDIKIIVKFFNPTGAGTWYCYEYEQEEGIFWCFANIGNDTFAECGTVALSEIQNFRGRFNLGIERDIHFGIKHTLKDVIDFKVR